MNKRGILVKTATVMLLATILSGCFLTKIVTVPMRLVGAIVSIIPVAGNTANKVIQTSADTVDDLPI
jgi:hypothetical protein